MPAHSIPYIMVKRGNDSAGHAANQQRDNIFIVEQRQEVSAQVLRESLETRCMLPACPPSREATRLSHWQWPVGLGSAASRREGLPPTAVACKPRNMRLY